MEMNWIEKIKEAVHVAINKGIYINGHIEDNNNTFYFYIGEITIVCFQETIIVTVRGGFAEIKYILTDRDKLELQALILSINEHRENVAISKLEEFISEKEDKITSINDLDSEDD